MDNLQPTIQPTIWETNPKLKTLLLVLIVVCFLSGIGLVIFSQWSNNYREQVYEETVSGLPTHKSTKSEPVVVAAAEKGWVTYINNTYGYQISYPSESQLNADYEAQQVWIYLGDDENIAISPIDKKTNLEDLLTGTKTKHLKIGNNDVLQGEGYGYAHNYFINSYFQGQQYNYGVGMSGSYSQKYLSLYSKILSTFKFTK
ncbi:MAG TPA: hypothetical protein VE973_01945 [Candidatus Limnocylindria bacterium]|nr:hypothetical protein [Candidatus Limnocylindria bacterium]